MIEYNVFQSHNIEDYRIPIYRGTDKDEAVKLINISNSDLDDSLVGFRWTTCIETREISEWQATTLDKLLALD